MTVIFEGTVHTLIFAQLLGAARALVDALMAKLITLKVEENKVLVFSIRAELSVYNPTSRHFYLAKVGSGYLCTNLERCVHG